MIGAATNSKVSHPNLDEHTLHPSVTRMRLAWMCALSPVLLLCVCVMSVPLFRVVFGHWPGEGSLSLSKKELDFGAPIALGMWLVIFALIHLIVTAIHHRKLGFRPSQIALLASTFVIGSIIFFVVTTNVQTLSWWLD